MRITSLLLALLLLAPVPGHAANCAPPANGTSAKVPGRPFGLGVTRDGCWMFAAMTTGPRRGAIAVLQDRDGAFAAVRTVPLQRPGFGVARSHDGRWFVVTEGAAIVVFDARGLERGSAAAPAGRLRLAGGTGAVYAAFGPDDQLLFVSDEDRRRIVVYDFAKWQLAGFTGNPRIGDIPAADGPVGLAVSPDGKWLYATIQVVPVAAGGGPRSCAPEVAQERRHPQGLVMRIAIAKAARYPRDSVAGAIRAGCNPVRVAVSPDGAYVWVTARDSGAILQIPASAFGGRGSEVAVRSFRVGTSPVGIAVRPDGDQVWVALSNRFARQGRSAAGHELVGLLGIDAPGATLKLASEPANGFPRELAFLPDGRTLAVGLYDARCIDFFRTP